MGRGNRIYRSAELRQQKQSLRSPDSRRALFHRTQAGQDSRVGGEVQSLRSQPRAQERKYGNLRAPRAPAARAGGKGGLERGRWGGGAPAPGGQLRELGRARPGPARARHAAGAEQGLLAPGRICSEVWVSSLGNRLDSFPWANVSYLFNLAVQPLGAAGRGGGRASGGWWRWGAKGGTFAPLRTDRGCLAPSWGPFLAPPDRGGQPTPRSTPVGLGTRKPGRSHLSKVLE